MARLIDDIRITNNKIYENMPQDRLRPPRPAPLSGGSAAAVAGPAHGHGTRAHGDTDSPRNTDAASNTHAQATLAVANGPAAAKKKKGRPRLFLAQVVERTATAFVVLVKFNVRNKLARRYFGLGAPPVSAAAVAPLARLRPPLLRRPLGPADDETSETRLRRKRVALLPRTRDAVAARAARPAARLAGQTETRRRHSVLLANTRLREAATERLLESLEMDLPYHGVLAFPDCIINHTDPAARDRERFHEFARVAAEKHAALQAQMLAGTVSESSPAATPVPQGASHYYLRSQIEKLQMRECLVDTWYSSPYPEEFARNKVLYVCEFCLKYMSSPQAYLRHQQKSCNAFQNHPPGVEIYRDVAARIAFWEVDGRKNIEYCQSLCLLAKLFLNSKTLYYDVEPFVFYILTEIDEQDSSTHHFVGYFSKEKLNNSDYNVSCILTLPIYQRKGYGSLMIDFSYLLSRREFKYGTPEKPLSDLGLVSYRNYWKVAVASTLRKIHDRFAKDELSSVPVSLDNIAQLTGMKPSDVVFALELLEALVVNRETGRYAILINLLVINAVNSKWELRNYVKLNPDLLLWKPLIYGPSGGINSAPPLALIPQADSEVPVVSNSISMITEFLKDDIGNPYTFEEEAYRSIKTVIESEKQSLVRLLFNTDNYRVCLPDLEMGKEELQTQSLNDVKLAGSESDNEGGLETELDADIESSDPGSEEFLDADSDVGTVDEKLSKLVRAGDIVSDEDEEVEFSGGESEAEAEEDGEEDGEDDGVVEDDAEDAAEDDAEDNEDAENMNGDDESDKDVSEEEDRERDEDAAENIIDGHSLSNFSQTRKTRSRRREEPNPRPARRTRRGGAIT